MYDIANNALAYLMNIETRFGFARISKDQRNRREDSSKAVVNAWSMLAFKRKQQNPRSTAKGKEVRKDRKISRGKFLGMPL